MRRPLIAGNWKMYHTPGSGVEMLQKLLPKVEAAEAEVLICMPFTHLALAAFVLENTNVRLGAENLHWEREGAYTGEIAAPMLAELGVSYVLVGHSERRQYFAETDEIVSRKAAAALADGLTPIICVGETQEQRAAGETFQVIEAQLVGSLAFWQGDAELVIAYEPVWAIGTGLNATAADAQAVIGFIRQTLGRLSSRADEIRILYGGSVKAATIGELMAQPDIDGALVGGASLEADSFAAIVNYPQ